MCDYYTLVEYLDEVFGEINYTKDELTELEFKLINECPDYDIRDGEKIFPESVLDSVILDWD